MPLFSHINCPCLVNLHASGTGKMCNGDFSAEGWLVLNRNHDVFFAAKFGERSGGASPSRVEISEPEPTSLMAELQQLQGKVAPRPGFD